MVLGYAVLLGGMDATARIHRGYSGAVVGPLAVGAQQRMKVPRIGYLGYFPGYFPTCT
jgi:hypothetical protein